MRNFPHELDIIQFTGRNGREFCKGILAPYFAPLNIFIQSPLIKKSMGGVVRWNILKKEIRTYLREADVYVTMIIDCYGLYNKHSFPSWDDGEQIANKNHRMDLHYFAEAIGLDRIRSKSPRFNNWIEMIENLP